MKKSTIFALLLLSMLCAVAVAQTTDKQWQAKAVQKYPELGVQGSDFNKRFIDEHNKRRNTSPAFFADPKWPLTLADELAATPPAPPAKLPPTDTLSTRLSSTWETFPSETRLIIVLAGVVMALAICHSAAKRFKRWLHWRRICADSDEYFAIMDESVGLPTLPTNLLLQYDERAFYCAPSSLFETRAVRYSQSGFVGFRVARGVWVGGSQGRSVSNQEWTKIDSGTLTVTNQRIVFDGEREVRTIPLKRIVSVESMRDSVDLAIENRQKSMVFEAANPLILASIIRLSCKGYDNLSRDAHRLEHASRLSNGTPNGTTTAAPKPRPIKPSPAPKPKKERARPAPKKPEVEPDDVVHARTLGLSGAFDFAAVKSHYYDRIKEYHPDKVAALGPKLRELAEIESKKINAAYEFFTKKFKTGRNG
jgi:hypothetical protein